MKSTISRVLVLMVIAVSVVAVQAQSQTMLKGKIPFSFSVGKQQLSSGPYTITSLGHEVECLKDSNGRSVIFITIGMETRDAVQPKLVFRRYGNEYVLTQIWTQFAGHEVVQHKRYAKLARSEKGETVEVALLVAPAK